MKGNMLWGFQQLGNPVLLAIPLFVLAGTIMSVSGIAASLLRFVNIFVGHLRGGLGVVATISCALIGAISGSGLTGVAAIGPLLIPEMEKQGYPREYATALIANASLLGLLIPPSVTMIVYGWVTDTSILACFLATLGPGLLIMFNFAVVNLVMARKFDLILDEPMKVGEMIKQAGGKTVHATPALLMPAIILGGIYGGIMTPTEAAGIAVVYAIPVAIYFYKGLTWKTLAQTIQRSGITIGVVMAMIFMVLIVSDNLIAQGAPTLAKELVYSVSDNPIVVLLMINVVMILIGMLMDDISGLLLATPILLPIAQSTGMDPIHFAAVIGVNLGMANITPPTAPLLYLGAQVCDVPVAKMLWPTLIFIVFAWLPTLMLTTFIPELALFLPDLLLSR